MSHHALQPLYRFRWRCVLTSAIEELPVLRDRSKTIGGFENIIHYLRERSDGQWDLDQHLSNQKDRADITAYVFHLLLSTQVSTTECLALQLLLLPYFPSPTTPRSLSLRRQRQLYQNPHRLLLDPPMANPVLRPAPVTDSRPSANRTSGSFVSRPRHSRRGTKK